MSFVTISKPNCVPQREIKEKINQYCLVVSWENIVINHNLDTQKIAAVQQYVKIQLEDESGLLVLRNCEVCWKITEQKNPDMYFYLTSFGFNAFISQAVN